MDVTTAPTGLTAAEVQERVARGQTNDTGERTSRKVSEIVRANVFTRFNAILGAAAAVILVIGPIQDALFVLILVANSAIGIFQEVNAKRKLDQLAIKSAAPVRVVRDGDAQEVAADGVVLDDLVEVRAGDQIACDGVVTAATGLEVNESLLTGESDPINKVEGDDILSGSFVAAGSGRFQATKVGPDSYAAKLAKEARQFQLTRSELMEGINTILRIITWVLIPVCALLLWSQLRHHELDTALRSTVAGVVAMVPEGLILLTSVAFMLAAVTLARRQVLVQELPAVEGLARVDVVCLDKTGTLTEGTIVFDELEALDGADEQAVQKALGALADDPNRNATAVALAEEFSSPGWTRTGEVPFSSARKWSAATFDGQGSWVMGAPEMVLTDNSSPVRARADELASSGRRTLVLARSSSPLRDESLPSDLAPVALVMFAEKVRPDAADTLAYFAAQGVELRVISGDNPRTVAAVAARVGLDDESGGFDARELPEDQDEMGEVLEQHRVFGRVTPQQKRAMVGALQSNGHVVAMTGDGVNDALALKDADIGVAMGSGAAATRAVAQLVLLEGKFSTLPGVVAEGRRVMANIERSANLFVTKTVYAVLLAITVSVISWPYPYLPRHLTIVSVFTIGVPGFFLALAPNSRRYVPGFIVRVLRFCIPAGIVAGTAALVAYGIARYGHDLPTREIRTTSALVLIAVALWVLVIQARPFTPLRSNGWKAVLVAAMVGAVVLILLVPAFRDFYAVQLPPAQVLGEAAIVAGVAIVLLEVGWRFSRVIGSRRNPHEVVDHEPDDEMELARANPSS